MIDLYNTVIDQSVIIGVGPLMVKKSTDQIAISYNERSYYFQVYTRNYHFTISTDLLAFSGDDLGASKEEHAAILQAHKELKECLISRNFTGMRFPLPND